MKVVSHDWLTMKIAATGPVRKYFSDCCIRNIFLTCTQKIMTTAQFLLTSLIYTNESTTPCQYYTPYFLIILDILKTKKSDFERLILSQNFGK